MNLLNKIVHSGFGIAGDVEESLQMLCSSNCQNNFGIWWEWEYLSRELKQNMYASQKLRSRVLYARSPALGGSTIAVTLGDTTALRTVENTSSAFPQWNSTLVNPENVHLKCEFIMGDGEREKQGNDNAILAYH